jgi:transcriptional regulator with XRE-family HTH domain
MAESIQKWVAKRIKELRKLRGVSQLKLASEVGVDQGYIGQIERGGRNVTIETLYRLCGALGISLEEFFQGIAKPKSSDEFLVRELMTVARLKPTKAKQIILDVAKHLSVPLK